MGAIYLDKGAEKALAARKSLLTVGVVKTVGNFSAGQVVQLMNEAEEIMGVAKTKIDSSTIMQQRSMKNTIAAHADDIVIF
jgi:glutamate 5-kinase